MHYLKHEPLLNEGDNDNAALEKARCIIYDNEMSREDKWELLCQLSFKANNQVATDYILNFFSGPEDIQKLPPRQLSMNILSFF